MRRLTRSTCRMSDLRLVIFDVDGTLVDSAGDIYGAMTRAYADVGLVAPSPEAVRAIIGLSLDSAFRRLSPATDAATNARLIEGYKDAYLEMRIEHGVADSSPLFPGAREALEALQTDPWTILAVATGKSRRGLDKLIEGHKLEGVFVSRQVADDHPSKPNPSMIHAALAETGVAASRAVMIGDTSYDMDMARAAGVRSIGVAWGYHAADTLGADAIAPDFAAIPNLVQALLEGH